MKWAISSVRRWAWAFSGRRPLRINVYVSVSRPGSSSSVAIGSTVWKISPKDACKGAGASGVANGRSTMCVNIASSRAGRWRANDVYVLPTALSAPREPSAATAVMIAPLSLK